MKNEEFIARYGEERWNMTLEDWREWFVTLRKEQNDKQREWYRLHPEIIKARGYLASRKGGRYYEAQLKYQTIGIPGERQRIRRIHRTQWGKYKKLIAPDSQIHHEWIAGTSMYRGVALVEKAAHRYGIIDVIQILDGKITVLTEEELKRRRN